MPVAATPEDKYPWVRGNTFAFLYNPKNFGPTVAPFNTPLPGGLPPGMEKYEVEEDAGKYKIYRCEEMHDPYMLILKIDRFTFVFYMHDDEAVMHWKQEYSFASQQGLLKAFLPEKPAELTHITIPMNMRAFGL